MITNTLKETENQRDSTELLDIESISLASTAVEKKQSWKEILMLSFTSLGAIYGDLGTSPLYALNSIKYKDATPTQEDILGAVSCIFYIFTLIVIFKYVLIVLFLGPNNGEGGQVAIYAKISRHLKLGPRGVIIPGSPETDDLEMLKRVDTVHSEYPTDTKSWKMRPSVLKVVKFTITILCFIGCSLVVSDGLLTRTTSVLSAVGGIQIAIPSFSNAKVLGIAEAVLVGLFCLQPFGSHKVSFLFAPILFIWMCGLIVCGIYNIVVHDPTVFKALSPYYAIKLLRRSGYTVFGGAMLAITGCEAMFADIGHFGRLPIQLTLTCFVYPALVLTYLGQGAYLIKHPEAWTNPFYNSLPGGANSVPYWIMFGLANVSTVIASQALILSVFSIVSQLVRLDCFPQVKVVRVSKNYAGKVYIPVVNWMMMVGVGLTTLGFQTSNNVTAAYGLGINLDFIVTSTLICLCMVYVKEWPIIVPIAYTCFFIPVEMLMIISNIQKVPHGAWFPLVVATALTAFLSTWRWCRSKQVNVELSSRKRVTSLDFTNVERRAHQVGFLYNDSDIALTPNTVPGIYAKIIKQFQFLPATLVFVRSTIATVPYLDEKDRILLAESSKLPGHYKVQIRFGFMEEKKLDDKLVQKILSNIPQVDTTKDTVLHIIEKNMLRCAAPNGTSRWSKVCHALRSLPINWLYAPLSSLTQENLQLLKLAEGEAECLYLGGLTRI